MPFMRADQFRTLLDARPFRAFRVWITSGQTVDVIRPGTAIVAHTSFMAAIRPNRLGIAQGGVAMYRFSDVARITYLKTSPPRERRARTRCAPATGRRTRMRADEFRKILARRPFEPVRVLITSGETVDIRHPEQAVVSASMFAFATGPRKHVVTDLGWYSLAHVVKVVPLNSLRRRNRRQSSA
jgi:hypothetical protein